MRTTIVLGSITLICLVLVAAIPGPGTSAVEDEVPETNTLGSICDAVSFLFGRITNVRYEKWEDETYTCFTPVRGFHWTWDEANGLNPLVPWFLWGGDIRIIEADFRGTFTSIWICGILHHKARGP